MIGSETRGNAIFTDNTTLDLLLRGFVLAAAALVWITILIRINGLRTLSKMTNFDFVMTVAMGSVAAGAAQASEWPAFAQSMLAMAGLVFAQFVSAIIRSRSDTAEAVMQNEPLLIMRNGEILEDDLDKARMTKSDLLAKLREANVLHFSKVRAVILETTGDVSVLHGDSLDDALIENVRCND